MKKKDIFKEDTIILGKGSFAHTHNLQILPNEKFKDSNGITPNIFPIIFISIPRATFCLRYWSGFWLNPDETCI